MKDFINILETCLLFHDIRKDDIQKLINCLSAVNRRYAKNNIIFSNEEKAESIGIVLSGAVYIQRENFWGNRVIIARVEQGELFGEAFAGAGVEKLPVNVTAAEESEIMIIDCSRILVSCSSACRFHSELIKNLMRILADKNIMLTQKLELVTQRTTREKLMSYLSEQARINGSSSFDIPFNRQELADYLSVDRSAMSAELSKMRRENIVRYKLNHFELINSASKS